MQPDIETTDAKILYVYYTPSWGRNWAGAVIITYVNVGKLVRMLTLTRSLIDEMKPSIRTRIDQSTLQCLEVRRGIDIEAFVDRVKSALTESGCRVTATQDTAIS